MDIQFSKKTKLFCLAAVFIALLGEGMASTRQASSCQQQAVQDAINGSQNGDTVLVPEGTCTWSATVTIPNSKGISLMGAGNDRTVIVDATPNGSDPLIRLVTVEGKSFRISGFTFQGATGWEGIIELKGATKTFRIDHCRFDFTQNRDNRGIYIRDNAYGVIDHCVFESPGETVNAVYVYGDDFDAWKRPYHPGTSEAVYVEDCTFDFGVIHQGAAALDGTRGGKAVFRHNTVRNQNVVAHGLDSGKARSMQALEIYSNTFRNEGLMARGIHLRGGTATVFDNVFQGQWGTMMSFSIYRSCCTSNALCSNWQEINSEPEKLCSNEHSRACHTDADCQSPGRCTTMFCSVTRDQMCSSNAECPSGESCTSYLDGQQDPSGYPGRDQIGRVANQRLSPVYEWGNTVNPTTGEIVGVTPLTDCPNVDQSVYIRAGRDYYVNTQRPGYTPYRYPHPLAIDSSAPNAPSNLRPAP